MYMVLNHAVCDDMLFKIYEATAGRRTRFEAKNFLMEDENYERFSLGTTWELIF